MVGAILLGCNDNPTDFDSKAYLNTSSKKTSFMLVSDTPEYTTSLSVGYPRPAPNTLDFTLEANPNLVPAYNSIFKESAIMLPQECYKIEDPTARIAIGTIKSKDIKIEFMKLDSLKEVDEEAVYVLPVTIARASNTEVLESGRSHYYIFKGGALINVAANIEKNYFPVKWGNNALVTGLSELTIESLLYLDTEERDGSDSQIMSVFGIEGHFLIRLGDSFGPGFIQVVKPTGNYPTDAGKRVKAPVEKWFHLAVTISTDGTLSIYIDGELKSTSVTPTSTLNLASTLNGGCFIGYSWNGNRWWPGMISETRLWNKARRADDIKKSMYRVDPESEGLVAYWKFDEGNGTSIKDYTGKNPSLNANKPLTWVEVSLPE